VRLTADEVRRDVAELLDVAPESVNDDDNLIEHGLDSLRLMKLAGGWRRRGVTITFAELAERPAVGAWLALLAGRDAARAAGAAPDPGTPAAPAEPDDPAGPGTGAGSGDPAFPLAPMQHAYWVGRGDTQTLGGVAAHLYTEFDLDPDAPADPTGRPPAAALDPVAAPAGAPAPVPGDPSAPPAIDPARLEAAARALVARHPALRTRVTDDGRQLVLPDAPGPVLTVEDLRALAPAAVAERLDAIRDTCSHQMLDIEAGRVFDLRLTLLPGGRTRLHLDVDMVAADALSFRVLLADLAALYTGTELAPLAYDHRRYLAERPAPPPAAAERARAHWHARVPDLPGAPELPLRPEAELADGATRVTRRHLWLTPAEKHHWLDRAHAHGVTPAMALATAFATTIAAWSAEERFLLNLPLFDREEIHPDVPRLVGDFTGSILLDVDLTRPRTFLEDARALQARMHADAAHGEVGGLDVLREMSRHRGEQVVAPVVYTSALGLGELFGPEVRRLFGEPSWIVSQGPQVLLDAQVTEVNGGLLVNWDIREDAFREGVADAMFAAYRDLVTRLGAPDADWNQVAPAPSAPGRREARARADDTGAAAGRRLLHEGFFAHAAATPDAVAVLAGGRADTLTYGELADRALRVAAALRARGVGPGDTVAVTLPKGPAQIEAVLGVLAAGAAYVPVGVEQPPARRERIHRRAGVALVLDADGRTGASPAAVSLALAQAATRAPLDAPARVDPEAIAYVLFTSGSTGEPKGVEVPHRAAMNTIDDLDERFAVGPADRALALSALDFDLSVYDIFGMLSAGGAVVTVGDDDRHEPARWARFAREHRVTVVNCVPALLDMLLTAAAADPEHLGAGPRLVLLGGDWVTTDLPGRLHALAPDCRFVALGGTTETAIHSTIQEVPAGAEIPSWWRSVPYGTPLRGVRCRVVDALGRDRPDHVPGELWIGGDGVAAGYRGDPGRTADRFVTVGGVRWYRTGDLARYLPDGTLEFLGRRDHQIKLRGFRIELGEIEAALAETAGVRRAVAGLTDGARPALAAAVVADGAEVTAELVLEQARLLLPPHMIPDQVLVLPELPLTANGKTDRAALGRLWSAARPAGGAAPARNAVEGLVALVWRELLAAAGTDPGPVGRDDDFFALGGDSVLATAAVAALRDALDVTTPTVRMLFAARTPAALAERVTAADDDPARLEAVADVHLRVAALSDDEVERALLG
jgi:mycobactin phenyloxazoline synthetase